MEQIPTSAEAPREELAEGWELAWRRLLWLVRPIGFLVVLLWVLSPGTSDTFQQQEKALLGFLFGALYGVLFYAEEFRRYILGKGELGRDSHNRIPSDYYIANILEIREK